MKKILSLFLVVAMMLSFATIASAATDVTYNVTILDKAGQAITGELNPGDEFVIQIKSDVAVDTFGMWITLDDDAFEEANSVKYTYINEDEETVVEYKQMTCGTFTASVVNNPDKTEDVISVGGFKTSASKVTCKLGYKVSENAVGGIYPIEIQKFVADAMGSYNGVVGTKGSVTIAGAVVEPTVPTAADLGLVTDVEQTFVKKDITVTNEKNEEYTVKTAIGFASSIMAKYVVQDAGVVNGYANGVTEFGTRITLGEDSRDIVAKHVTIDGENAVFAAAVTSIRPENMGKTFTATAYAKGEGFDLTAAEVASQKADFE